MKATALKGLAVLLPTILLVSITLWVVRFLTRVGEPYAKAVSKALDVPQTVGVVIVTVGFIFVCFCIGKLVTTAAGAKWRHLLESEIFDRAPGYAILRNVVAQFLGGEKSPLSAFAFVEFKKSGLRLSGFITDRSETGWCTVFVPTAPNPTSGLILHVKEDEVKRLNISGADAIETIIGCGVGSAELHEKLEELTKNNTSNN